MSSVFIYTLMHAMNLILELYVISIIGLHWRPHGAYVAKNYYSFDCLEHL